LLLLKDFVSSPPNKREAYFWFKKVAERGNPNGMLNYERLLKVIEGRF
jgi:TPR repeat protein